VFTFTTHAKHLNFENASVLKRNATVAIFTLHDFRSSIIIYLLTAMKGVCDDPLFTSHEETKQFYCACVLHIYPGGGTSCCKPPALSLPLAYVVHDDVTRSKDTLIPPLLVRSSPRIVTAPFIGNKIVSL
jgi:hypothetical protein